MWVVLQLWTSRLPIYQGWPKIIKSLFELKCLNWIRMKENRSVLSLQKRRVQNTGCLFTHELFWWKNEGKDCCLFVCSYFMTEHLWRTEKYGSTFSFYKFFNSNCYFFLIIPSITNFNLLHFLYHSLPPVLRLNNQLHRAYSLRN